MALDTLEIDEHNERVKRQRRQHAARRAPRQVQP